MKILYTGTDKRCKEFEEKFSPLGFDLIRFNFNDISAINPKIFDAIFDLEFDDHQERFETYASYINLPIILSTVKTTLLQQTIKFTPVAKSLIFGMNALPTFINRAVWEMTALGKDAQEYYIQLKKNLQLDAVLVPDRIGMVTPRVVFMIINEAFYTLQEGTANKEDIDTAMKLGTAYPMGPFEWARQTGIRNVAETLEALYQDTHDERYRICPLLKSEYIQQQSLQAAISLSV